MAKISQFETDDLGQNYEFLHRCLLQYLNTIWLSFGSTSVHAYMEV